MTTDLFLEGFVFNQKKSELKQTNDFSFLVSHLFSYNTLGNPQYTVTIIVVTRYRS
jgi:hypothetical protein